jgi:hypothetical protein
MYFVMEACSSEVPDLILGVMGVLDNVTYQSGRQKASIFSPSSLDVLVICHYSFTVLASSRFKFLRIMLFSKCGPDR